MNIKIKELTIVLSVIIASSFSLASDGVASKKEVLSACKKQAKQAPNKKMQNYLIDACKCTVEKTDFDKVHELEKNKDQKGLRALLVDVASYCRKK